MNVEAAAVASDPPGVTGGLAFGRRSHITIVTSSGNVLVTSPRTRDADSLDISRDMVEEE